MQYIRNMKDDEFSSSTQRQAAHEIRVFSVFLLFSFFVHGVKHQEIKLYLPVIYFSFGQLNEVIVYVWSAACYGGNKIKGTRRA